ncbi:MAG: hypothetical protein U0271_01370 [Polyangiaceae bacterium]
MAPKRWLRARVLSALFVACFPTVVRAEDSPTPAEVLFREAKADVERGDLASACPKFERSWTESHVVGALLSWADCEERRGRLVLARDLFAESVPLVDADAERTEFVRARLATLAPAIPQLVITVAAGVVVEIDGRAIDLTKPFAEVDPGTHHLVARGSEQRSQVRDVNLARGERLAISLLVEEPRVPPRARDAAPREASTGLSPIVLAGWISGGVGVAGGIAFAATGGAVVATCEDGVCPASYEGVLVGNVVAAGVFGLGVALGAILLGVGYASEPSQPTARVTAGPGELGLGLEASF